MTTFTEIFQGELWHRERDRGEASAIKHATAVVPSALSALRQQIEWLAASQQPFTVESVMRRLPPGVLECLKGSLEQRRFNAIGAEFSQAARAGLIRWTGEVERSSSTNRHGGLVRIWVGAGK